MSKHRIFHPNALAVDSVVALRPLAAQHLSRALRMKVGDEIRLFDNSGDEFQAKLQTVTKHSVEVLVETRLTVDSESPLQVEVGLVVSKGDRFEYAVQKMTELGVSRIQPLISERCDVRMDEDRQAKKSERWQEIAIAACEQSQRVKVPEVLPWLSLDRWTSEVTAQRKLVLHTQAQRMLESEPHPESVALLIGPEGGLTETEVSNATMKGFQVLQLGPRVLRTETAPVVALSLVQTLWGDMVQLV